MDYIKLNTVSDIFLGLTHTPSYVSEGIPFLSVKDISSGEMKFSNTKYISQDEYDSLPNGAKPKTGDILFCRVGTLGKPIILTSELPTFGIFVSLGFLRIKDKNIIYDKYLKHWMNSKFFFRQVDANITGAAQVNLNTTWLKNFDIPFYSLPEQQKIAAHLDSIQSAIDNKKQQLQQLDELVKSKFVEMFGEIDLSLEKDDWTQLKDIAKIFTGTTPSTAKEENWNGDIPWITPAEMNSETFYVNDTERKITEIGRASKSLELMPIGTVLLSTRAPIGKVGIVNTPMTCNQGFKNFLCSKDKMHPVYLYILLKNNTEYLNSKGTGTTFIELSKTNAEKIKIPVPSIELQNTFAEYVQNIDSAKSIIKNQLIDLQELLDSKMDEYFA